MIWLLFLLCFFAALIVAKAEAFRSSINRWWLDVVSDEHADLSEDELTEEMRLW